MQSIDPFERFGQSSRPTFVFGGPSLEESLGIMAVLRIAEVARYKRHKCPPVGGELGDKRVPVLLRELIGEFTNPGKSWAAEDRNRLLGLELIRQRMERAF